jgi:hypothetical protein
VLVVSFQNSDLSNHLVANHAPSANDFKEFFVCKFNVVIVINLKWNNEKHKNILLFKT